MQHYFIYSFRVLSKGEWSFGVVLENLLGLSNPMLATSARIGMAYSLGCSFGMQKAGPEQGYPRHVYSYSHHFKHV